MFYAKMLMLRFQLQLMQSCRWETGLQRRPGPRVAGYAVDHGIFAHCHACAFGGLRSKKTSFLSNRSDISLMQLFCEDVEPHHHEPWAILLRAASQQQWKLSIKVVCVISLCAFWIQ